MTPVLQVLTEFCAQYVDDINLSELTVTNPPLFARKMYNYLPASIAKFKLPPEMQEYLLGTEQNPKFIPPRYNEASEYFDEEATEIVFIDLGTDYINYELFSAHIKKTDAVGNVEFIETNNVFYNPTTGEIRINASPENPIPAGTTYDFDFYSDGYFTENLSYEIMDILGLCFQVVWQNRFAEDWLSMVAKAEDKSFFEQNRANKINADTARLKEVRTQLNAAMRQYTENRYYMKTVPNYRKLTNL